MGPPSPEIPRCPPLIKGSCKKIERREAKASFVVRGRGNFLPSKPGGKYMAVKHCPGFRRATSATCGNSYKSKQRILRTSVGSIPSRPRRNKRLFWRQEISPSPGIPRPPNFSLPEFFHSFRGDGGISGSYGLDSKCCLGSCKLALAVPYNCLGQPLLPQLIFPRHPDTALHRVFEDRPAAGGGLKFSTSLNSLPFPSALQKIPSGIWAIQGAKILRD